MSQTVSSHQVAAFSTPINGAALDATIVRGNDNTLRSGYVSHDADAGIHLQSSALASRPAASEAGRKWLTTDTGSYRLFFDTGAAWQELSYLRTDAGGTVSGNVSVLGSITGLVNGGAQIIQSESDTQGVFRLLVGTAAADFTATATAAIMRTNDARPLIFATDLTERGRFDAVGNLGIGTNSPLALLHVAGTFLATGAATFNGNVTLGDATSDTITPTGRFAADLDPNANNTIDLGASGLAYKDGWFAGTVTAGNFSTAGALTFDPAGTGSAEDKYTRTNGVSSATTIYTETATSPDFSVVMVYGESGTDRFVDFVGTVAGGAGPTVVISSTTVGGSPATRTYSKSTTNLRLAMSAGSYTVGVRSFAFDI